jgi:5S rRNA maturation endonuclease (ribonuclease M5)
MPSPTREELLAAFPLAAAMERDGVKLIGPGPTKMALCCFHVETTPSLSVNTAKNLWHCFGCNTGGSVVDYLSLRQGKPVEQILSELSEQFKRRGPTLSRNGQSDASGQVVATYVYKSATGDDVYRVLRYDPKNFRQQRWTGGAWAWGMDGVERVLYHLPEILAAGDKPIVIVEGEKDAENVAKLGWVATTNVGGGGNWMEGYSEALKGRSVVLCGDNDEAGRKHVAKVIDALDGKCGALRHIVVPSPAKDISEYLAGFGNLEAKKQAFEELFVKAAVLVAGSTVPILSMAELEDRYQALLARKDEGTYSFTNWLPTFGHRIRPSMPGDIIAFVASTGSGKTALLQNMAWRAAPLPCLLFEMELADSITFERFVAGVTGLFQSEVEDAYKAGTPPDWRDTGYLQNIYVCPMSGLTVPVIETIVSRAELKMGVKPVLVLVDYVQLVRGLGKSRYEQITSVMSDLKSMAKNTHTIVVVASQVPRGAKGAPIEIGLSDGKDSGQIENSAALHIGAWRDPKNEDKTLILRINKNTRGYSGLRLPCNWDGARMLITERIESPSAP